MTRRCLREGPAVGVRQGGPGRAGPGPLRPGVEAGRQRQHGGQAERGRHRPHRGGPGDGLARDARWAGQDPPPEDPRRHPRRPLQGRAPRRPRNQWDRRDRPRGVEPLSVLLRPLHRADRHRGPGHGAAAAKNHEHVGIVTSPADYPVVLEELRASGSLSAATRRRLARAAFAHTAAYDAAIVAWLDAGGPAPVGDLAGRHRRRRRGGRAVRGPPGDPAPHARTHRGAAIRREPAPAGRALRQAGTTSWWDGMVQHGQPAVLPQHLRRRRGVAPGPRAGR